MKKLIFVIVSATIFVFDKLRTKVIRKTVVFTVDVSAIKNIKTVSLRGGEKPLNWRKGINMTPIKTDSLYTATVTFLTGYKFTEVKFVVNDEFELKDKDNRRVQYSDADTTLYKAVYDVE